MCGITGIITKDGRPVTREEIKILNDLVAHRGPDGEDFFFHHNLALGHRRLAVIDLSDAGKQPMQYRGLVITYNGEIYNYLQLRQELTSLGYHFSSQTDTEVILAAYLAWGKNCILKFQGMWAFALYDPSASEIFMSRDRFGIKPLYFLNAADSFAFASEIKPLITLLKEVRAHHQTLFDYLFLSIQHHTSQTFFQNIESLLPGHNLIYNLQSHTKVVEKYYYLKPDLSIRALSFKDSVELYREKLAVVVKQHLHSDVPVGTCLSGGLDSSVIAALASKTYNHQSTEKFKAITAKSIESKTDETDFAQQVANHAALDWHVTEPSIHDLSSSLEELIKVQEEPFLELSVAMQFFVMKKAHEVGCTVLLDGQGGDETLLGYGRYVANYLQQVAWRDLPKEFSQISKNSGLLFKDLLTYYFYFTNYTLRKSVLQSRYGFIKKPYLEFFNDHLLKDIVGAYQNMDSMQQMEIQQTQLPKLLLYEDKNAMHHSIEARVPLLDVDLVAIAVSLPSTSKIRNGWTKYPLRLAADKILPKTIAWRKKKFGFEAPASLWMRINKNEMEKVILQSEGLHTFVRPEVIRSIKHSDTLWKLYILARWMEIFKVKF